MKKCRSNFKKIEQVFFLVILKLIRGHLRGIFAIFFVYSRMSESQLSSRVTFLSETMLKYLAYVVKSAHTQIKLELFFRLEPKTRNIPLNDFWAIVKTIKFTLVGIRMVRVMSFSPYEKHLFHQIKTYTINNSAGLQITLWTIW